MKGEVVVEQGSLVTADHIVARTFIPGNVQIVNVANLLNVDPADVSEVMVAKKDGEIGEGDLLAETQGIFGMFKSKTTSPVSGTVESISTVTGQVILREAPLPVEVDAYIAGNVAEIITDEGVHIESIGVFIQGIFGIAGEKRGNLELIVKSRDDEITPEMINDSHKNKILVGGSHITLQAYKKAVDIDVHGIIVGGFNYHDLKPLLGYSLGVAITGSEKLATSLIVTEGFGKIPMGERTFDILLEFKGKFASINGATQIRAGVIRPEIVIPFDDETKVGTEHHDTSLGITDGSLVRVIRAPFFGKMGSVKSLPSELHKMESETMVRVAEVDIDGETMINVLKLNCVEF
jgi:hypothetical protein